MDLEFNQVTYDGDLDEAGPDDLRELIGQFEEAQEDNAAEFEAASEKLEEVDGVNVEEFHDARQNLIETITEFDSFEEAPLDEDDLEEADFARLRDFEEYFESQDADSEDADGDGEFGDMGKESPEGAGEISDAEFAEQYLGDVPGVNFADD